MGDLDDKLKTLDIEFLHGVPVHLKPEHIEQIKQIFADEGYVKVPDEVQETWRTYNNMAGYMTGQEWYDRLLKEVHKQPVSWPENASKEYIVAVVGNVYLAAAERAAGLDNE